MLHVTAEAIFLYPYSKGNPELFSTAILKLWKLLFAKHNFKKIIISKKGLKLLTAWMY